MNKTYNDYRNYEPEKIRGVFMNRIFLFSLLSLFSSLFFLGCGSDNLIKDGEKALADKDYKNAIKYFKKAIKKNPSAIPLFYNLGAAAAYAGDTDEAISAFREVLRFSPGDTETMEFLAANLRQEGSIDSLKESHELLSEVITIADISPSEKSRALTSLALTELAFHRPDLALAHLLTARAITPDYAPAIYNLAKLYADELKQYPLANATMLKFQAISTSDPNMREKASEFIKENKLAAEAATQSAYVASPDIENDINNAIKEYQKSNYQKALDSCEKALKISPRDYNAALYKAYALFSMNQLHDALNAFAYASECDSSSSTPINMQAHINYILGNNKEAIRILTTIFIPKWPEEIYPIQVATYSFTKEKRFYEAAAYAELVIATMKNAQIPTAEFEAWFNETKRDWNITFKP